MSLSSGERASPDDGGFVVCRVAGVPVLLSPSWWLGAGLIVLSYTPLVGRLVPVAGVWESAFVAAMLAALLGISVLLHELGHCLVALRLGLPVHRVRLFLLGGISEIASGRPSPRREGLIAAAGPAVSIGLAAATGLGWLALQPGGVVWLLIAQTCVANLAVGLFNLLPGLPLDGGRLLRAALWAGTGRRAAGTMAGVVGAGVIAFGLMVWAVAGLLRSDQDQWLRLGMCLLMAWFVIAGASAEHVAEQHRTWPVGLQVPKLVRPVLQLPAESPVCDALVAAAGRGVVLVRADGVAVGLLDQTAAERLATHSPREPAERAAVPVGPETILRSTDPPEAVLDRVRRVPSWQFLIVGADGRPQGVLRREDVRTALRTAASEG
jgi:Zn-dependent protease